MQSYLDQLTVKAKKKKINLIDAATHCGVSRSTVWRWLSGNAEISYRTATKIWSQLDKMRHDRAA